MTPVALTIAGSDPSGGAGLQADLKTFHQFGVYGMAAVSLLTVQNTQGVESVDPVDADYLRRQLDAVQRDIPPAAAKTGALGSAANIETVAAWAQRTGTPLVVDPVLVSTSGHSLALDEAVEAYLRSLLPVATLITPNLPEAERLTGLRIDDEAALAAAAELLVERGARAALVKGGHLPGAEAVDILRIGGKTIRLTASRIDTPHTHGTGCVYSAAVAAGLALGLDLEAAVRRAKAFVSAAIAAAPGLGAGRGPLGLHVKS